MRRLYTSNAILIAVALLLAGCSTFQPAVQYVPQTANVPPIPPDVEQCAADPSSRPSRLTAAEANRLWNQDRAALVKVNGCFERLVCQYHDVRHDIGRVEGEHVCDRVGEDMTPKAPKKSIRKRRK